MSDKRLRPNQRHTSPIAEQIRPAVKGTLILIPVPARVSYTCPHAGDIPRPCDLNTVNGPHFPLLIRGIGSAMDDGLNRSVSSRRHSALERTLALRQNLHDHQHAGHSSARGRDTTITFWNAVIRQGFRDRGRRDFANGGSGRLCQVLDYAKWCVRVSQKPIGRGSAGRGP
jgi:hypothetical protein